MKTITSEELNLFKRKASGYIRWVNKTSDLDPEDVREDCVSVRKAKTFKEAEDILKKHDDGTFLMLVEEGYF